MLYPSAKSMEIVPTDIKGVRLLLATPSISLMADEDFIQAHNQVVAKTFNMLMSSLYFLSHAK